MTVADVCVLDIKMPLRPGMGVRAALEIRSLWPQIGALVLSQYVELGLAHAPARWWRKRRGLLLKDRIADIEEFSIAVQRVGEGGSALACGGFVVDPGSPSRPSFHHTSLPVSRLYRSRR
jgi:DNA-binding NarL/FixJ family response regulator